AQDTSPGSTEACGGPVNSSYALRHVFVAGLSRGKLSLSVTMLIDNLFLYDVPRDMFTPGKAVDQGREDSTWGVIALGYAIDDHFSANIGLSSFQPALDAESKNLRFPFFDFSGPNANNFTQLFLSLTGTL